MRPATVIKVGGSLYDLPDLGPRLRRFLQPLEDKGVLLVPGGGRTADVVRALDQVHPLGDEASHWLALRAITLNAHFLADLLAPAHVVDDLGALSVADGRPAILDGHAFARRDERDHAAAALPHCWKATSDALALRAACVLQARRLVLLKSVSIPRGTDWSTAARYGWVDETFPEMLASAGPELQIAAVNLRD
jgi:aspartokinase-like uncharacterized kinase